MTDKALSLWLAGTARLVTSEGLLAELSGVLTEKFGVNAKDELGQREGRRLTRRERATAAAGEMRRERRPW